VRNKSAVSDLPSNPSHGVTSRISSHVDDPRNIPLSFKQGKKKINYLTYIQNIHHTKQLIAKRNSQSLIHLEEKQLANCIFL
jgi:hypothetical protein